MVILTITMPIIVTLLAAWRIKKSTREMLDEYIEIGKEYVVSSIQKPEFAALVQSIGAQLAQGMMQVGGKEIKSAIPKFKLNDLLMMGAMKMLGGGGLGDLGSLLGGSGEQQPQPSNTSTPKGKLE